MITLTLYRLSDKNEQYPLLWSTKPAIGLWCATPDEYKAAIKRLKGFLHIHKENEQVWGGFENPMA